MEHIGISKTDCRLAILVGDPDRVDLICDYSGVNVRLTSQRGYIVSQTSISGFNILVVATGIGSPSIAIAIEELSMLGVKQFLRIGTCGAIKEDLEPGSIVLSIGAVRDEGTSFQYLDTIFPAIADIELAHCILTHLSKYNKTFLYGITHSKDSFYSEKVELQIAPDEQKNKWLKLKHAGVLASDMETSCLYIVSFLRKARASSILVCVGEDKSDDRIKVGFSFILESLERIVREAHSLSMIESTRERDADRLSSFLEE
ncbi:nucleoside phosphorylase [Candidatus Pacearchaeota archaeon]|nr:nucleoside phosphorylase [Candidatus Pacearchaeota archaeon]